MSISTPKWEISVSSHIMTISCDNILHNTCILEIHECFFIPGLGHFVKQSKMHSMYSFSFYNCNFADTNNRVSFDSSPLIYTNQHDCMNTEGKSFWKLSWKWIFYATQFASTATGYCFLCLLSIGLSKTKALGKPKEAPSCDQHRSCPNPHFPLCLYTIDR